MSNLPVSERPERALLALRLCFWGRWGAWLCRACWGLHAPLAHRGQGPGRSRAHIVAGPGPWRDVLGLRATVPIQKPS